MSANQYKKCHLCAVSKSVNHYRISDHKTGILSHVCKECTIMRNNARQRLRYYCDIFSELYICDIRFRKLANLQAGISMGASNITKAKRNFACWVNEKNINLRSINIINEFIKDADNNYRLLTEYNNVIAVNGIYDTKIAKYNADISLCINYSSTKDELSQ